MKRQHSKTWARVAQVSVFVGSVLLAGTASAAPDGWITAKTKIALMAADNLDADDINVDTMDARVVLHGKVRTEAEKTAAERVAKKVDGVKQVQNLLQIVTKPEEEMVEASDDTIRKQIEKTLDDDASLDDSSIKLKSVNKGVVLLTGKAETLSDHLRALEIARTVPGVRQVRTDIKSGNELAEADVWRDEGSMENAPVAPADRTTAGQTPAGPKPGEIQAANTRRDMSTTARDMKITTSTKLRLYSNDKVPGTEINVDTKRGVVTLFGTVPSDEVKAMAEQEAKNVKGVTSVNNELQVVASARKEFVEAKDDEIKRSVEKALDGNRDFTNVDVDVKDGVVRLKGSVPSGWHEVEAARIARMQKGVRAVHSDIDLRFKEARGS